MLSLNANYSVIYAFFGCFYHCNCARCFVRYSLVSNLLSKKYSLLKRNYTRQFNLLGWKKCILVLGYWMKNTFLEQQVNFHHDQRVLIDGYYISLSQISYQLLFIYISDQIWGEWLWEVVFRKDKLKLS